MPTQKALANIISGIFLAASLAAIFIAGRRLSSCKEWLEAGLAAAMPLGMVSCLYFFDYDFVLLIPTLVAGGARSPGPGP